MELLRVLYLYHATMTCPNPFGSPIRVVHYLDCVIFALLRSVDGTKGWPQIDIDGLVEIRTSSYEEWRSL